MLFRKPKLGAPRGQSAVGREFSQGCREALSTAREEAIALGHEYVGTEHLLLALTHDRIGEGVSLFDALAIDAAVLRRDVEAVLQRGSARRDAVDLHALPYTSRSKKVLELAMRDAQERGERMVTVRELLAGLVREEHGIAAQILSNRGVTLQRVHALGESVGQLRAFRVVIDDASPRSITEQIVAQIREGVATGALQAEERLPAVRRLADDLDVAPGTVARAYAELEKLGVVVTGGARGTRVAPRVGPALPDGERREMLVGLLRPTAVAAFHLGASAAELHDALRAAMRDIFPPEGRGEGAV